jgi:hypothetical protein
MSQAGLEAIENNRPDAMLGVLEVKAAAGEASTEVADLGMRVCGGAAFRREVGIERHFRNARCHADGAHQRRALRFHRQGCVRHAVIWVTGRVSPRIGSRRSLFMTWPGPVAAVGADPPLQNAHGDWVW